MKLLTIDTQPGSAPGVLTEDGRVLNLADAGESGLPSSVRDILNVGLDGLTTIADYLTSNSGKAKPLEEVSLLAPVPNPNLILSVGLNYWKHLEEMAGTPVPKHPTAFHKARATLTGSGTNIHIPPHCPNMIDYEGELTVVMGTTCHNVTVDEAMDYVAGYTLANDVSARDWVGDVFNAEGSFPAILAWERNIHGKQLPGFTPCGPFLTTKDEIPDPHVLHMETRLNGAVMQSTNTDDMIFKIPELISYFSQWYQFKPGDLITTGSPAGVGFGRDPKVFMTSGDHVEVEADGLGTLTNTLK